MIDPMFDEQTRAILDRVTMESFRDYIARILGPSPFDFRGRHLMTKEQAEKTADELIERMKAMPESGAALIKQFLWGDEGIPMPFVDDETKKLHNSLVLELHRRQEAKR